MQSAFMMHGAGQYGQVNRGNRGVGGLGGAMRQPQHNGQYVGANAGGRPQNRMVSGINQVKLFYLKQKISLNLVTVLNNF